MSETPHIFGVGEYQMRDGHVAVVQSIVPDPTDTTYPLRGYIKGANTNLAATWTKRGEALSGMRDPSDLTPPRRQWLATLTPHNDVVAGHLYENMLIPRNSIRVVELRPGERVVGDRIEREEVDDE